MSILRKLLPRFSLRTLVIFPLLVTSAVALWLHWEPWALALSYEESVGFLPRPDPISPAHQRLLGKARSGFGVWDLATGRKLWQVANGELSKRSVLAFNGQRVLGILDGSGGARLWDAATGNVLADPTSASPINVRISSIIFPQKEGATPRESHPFE